MGVMVAVVFMIALIPGCTTHVPGPSTQATQPTGTVVIRPAETTASATPNPGVTDVSPENETPGNTTYRDVFFLGPVSDYHVGDNVTVHGTAILSAGDPLLVEVISSSFGPTPKGSSQAFTGVSGIVTVNKGPAGGPNTWSFSFPTEGFIEDTYIVTVSGITINVRDSTTFLLKPRL